MAIIWQKTHKGIQYQVRTAGNTLRLYTNGVFHSQYNPNKQITKGVWDLLMLPAYFYPPGTIKRILVLGVGGGAVIHLLHNHIQPESIVGVELNAVHLVVAKKYFAVSNEKTQLIHADAVKWLESYSGPTLDLIIDDMFGEEKQGATQRAIPLNRKWFTQINRHLSRRGMFIVNTHDYACFRNCAYRSNKKVTAYFESVFQFTMPHYGNRVFAFLKQSSTTAQLRQRLKQQSNVPSMKALASLKFSVRKIPAA